MGNSCLNSKQELLLYLLFQSVDFRSNPVRWGVDYVEN
jgi:hypothetical protein